MMIQEIISVTKQKSRVVTDEQLAFVLYKGELSRYRLKAGMELPDEVFQEIFQEILLKRAKRRAMHLLTRMDYTEDELYRKLMRGEYTKEAADAAIAYVKSFHYLDDERYAKNYLAGHSGSKSRRQMEFELGKKGISREMVSSCMQEGDQEDETKLIRKLLEKRCRNPQDADEKEKSRHYGYLMRKGFRGSDIQQVFQEFFERFS